MLKQKQQPSVNQSVHVQPVDWAGKTRISLDRKACLNLPERPLCLFLVYRLREIWLWETVQRRSLEKRRTAIKTLSERSDDSWISSRSPSLCLLTLTEVKMLRFVAPSSFPLLCLYSARLLSFFPWTGHRAPRLRLYELSQFCWHTHFFPPANPMCAIAWLRNTSRRKTQTKTSIIPWLLTSLRFLQLHSVLASFNVALHHVMWKTKRVIWAEGTNVVDHNNYSNGGFCWQT